MMADTLDYGMKVRDTVDYLGKTLDDLGDIIRERGINLTLMCPRKLPQFIS